MIGRDDLRVVELDATGWGAPEWRVSVDLPDGLGGTEELVLKMVSTKGLPGLPDGQKPRQGGGIHVYSRDETIWHGSITTWELEPALEELLGWLRSKATAQVLQYTAPVDQFVAVVEKWRQSLELSSQLDPEQVWDDVVSLAMEIGARMGRVGCDHD